MHTVSNAAPDDAANAPTPVTAAERGEGIPAERVRGAGATGLSKVAVAGATGYTGQELLRLLARHPAVAITSAMSSGASGPGKGIQRKLPSLAHVWNGDIAAFSAETLAAEADVVFLALPDQAAAEVAPALIDAGVRVVDLSGAFRLRDSAGRAKWYPETKTLPEGVAYGLTQRQRGAVGRARLVGNPGCYPNATLPALAPPAEDWVPVA